MKVLEGEDALLAQRYSQQAPEYEELWAPALHRVATRLLAHLPLQGARVLDLATGVGTLLSAIEQAGAAHVVGADRAEGMVRRIARRFQRLVADAQSLPFASRSFDVVVIAFALFHFPDGASALREARRVLRPGGTIGIITWGKDATLPAADAWVEELDRHGAAPASAIATDFEPFESPEKMRTALEQAGFGDVDAWVEPFGYYEGAEERLRRYTSMGLNKERFESLDPAARDSCLKRVRARLAHMSKDDFTDYSEVVFSIARATPA